MQEATTSTGEADELLEVDEILRRREQERGIDVTARMLSDPTYTVASAVFCGTLGEDQEEVMYRVTEHLVGSSRRRDDDGGGGSILLCDRYRVRELVRESSERFHRPLGSGCKFWASSSTLLSRWLSHNHVDAIDGMRVLELGAGCSGLPGIVAASFPAKRVCITDRVPQLLENVRFNIELNAHHRRRVTELDVAVLDWAEVSSVEDREVHCFWDVILSCECVFDGMNVEHLAGAIARLLAPSGCALFVHPSDGRGQQRDFFDAMGRVGLQASPPESLSQFVIADEDGEGPGATVFLHRFHRTA